MFLKVDYTEHSLLAIEVSNPEVVAYVIWYFAHTPSGNKFCNGHVTSSDQGLSFPEERAWERGWVQPPFSKNVKTNIAHRFLHLVDTHFPAGHKLHKIFNRNTVKVRYSCMNNVRSIITNHNTRIIRKGQTQVTSADNCNCRNTHMEACPLQNKCMNKDIVYKATISTSNANDTKHYIGMTSSTFKERYRNHIKSFTHKKYSNETELSKHIWHLKQNKTDFTIKWSIIKKSISYTGGSKRCNLCLEEKLHILKEKDNCLLNKRSEIISACQHKNRFQVKSLNKERIACYFNDNTPTFPPWA